MRSEGRKRRHSQLLKLIETNPLLTDEEISSKLGVSPQHRKARPRTARHTRAARKDARDGGTRREPSEVSARRTRSSANFLGLRARTRLGALHSRDRPRKWPFRTTDMAGDYYIYAPGLLARDSDDRRGDGRLRRRAPQILPSPAYIRRKDRRSLEGRHAQGQQIRA